MTTDPRSVLVVSLGGLGDFVTRWPLWQSVRRSFPGARLSYLGRLRHACLLRAAGLCDEAREFDGARSAAPAAARGGGGIVVSALGVRGMPWAERLADAAGAEHILTIEPFPPDGGRVPVGVHIEAEIAAAGLAEPGPSRCPLPEPLRAWAAGVLAARGLLGAVTIAIHHGSGSPAKNWPRERFEALAAALHGIGLRVLSLEGDAEREAGGGRPAIPGAAQAFGLDLTQVAALLAACRAYVGNDSGISHLAALLGVPATVLFGPTDPAVWAPRGRRVSVLAGRAPCAPCGREKMRECGERLCLAGIAVEEVVAACA